MEKEVESLKKEVNKDATKSEESVKVPAQIDGKELVQLFKSMSVSKHVEKTRQQQQLQLRNSKDWRTSKGNTVRPSQKTFKRRKVISHRKKPQVRINLRPSKLSSIVNKIKAEEQKPSDSRFSEFSADCSKALETIEKAAPKPKKKVTKSKKIKVNSDQVSHDKDSTTKAPLRAQKKRKASSSCAQQARNECYNTDVNASMDFLALALEEMYIPKKMSYMAELMYT